ncbi:MAG: hypothetical protein V1760_01055, partial [Candidatus Peregrinibacteria bacterium]
MKNKSFMSCLIVLGILLQASSSFAAAPSRETLFNQAWKEATASTNYSFTCTITSGVAKAPKTSNLTADQKKAVDITLEALKRYKNILKGTLSGGDRALTTSQDKINTLGVLNALGAGQLSLDQAMEAVKTAVSKKAQITLLSNQVYYQGDAGWKTFLDADFATHFFQSSIDNPLTSSFSKSSFTYKKEDKYGKEKALVYEGTMTAASTISLLVPFVGEEAGKQQPLAPTTLFISGDGHLRKIDVKEKVVVGGLSFTVSQRCEINFKKQAIKAPVG